MSDSTTIEGVTVAGPMVERTWSRDGRPWIEANPTIPARNGPIRFGISLGSMTPDGARTLAAMLTAAADWLESLPKEEQE